MSQPSSTASNPLPTPPTTSVVTAPAANTPVVVSTGGAKVLGIDTSHYEPEINWVAAKNSGVQWMYTKATEGLTHVDAYLTKHAPQAKAAGVYTGAYHFFHASMSGKDQAAFFLSTVKGMSFDLPHCLDWETSSADGLSAAIQAREARAFLDAVQSATGRVPMIYGGLSHLADMKLSVDWKMYPLWLAHYGVKSTLSPSPWARYTAWQYTDAETVGGLPAGHHVDASWFNGSLSDLQAFVRG